METIKGTYPFYESQYVQKHSKDLGLLERLNDVRLDQSYAKSLIEALTHEFGLTMPGLRFTGRTDRGTYWFWKHYQGETVYKTIVVRKDHIPVDVLCHELAHHWVHTKLEAGLPDHGFDFTLRLDKLAAEATEILDDWDLLPKRDTV